MGIFTGCLVIGVLIKRFLGKVALFITKTHRVLAMFYMVFCIVFGTYVNFYTLKVLERWQVAVACILLPWIGAVIAIILGLLCRIAKYKILTIATEAALQNAALALIIIEVSLDDPEKDLASVLPLVIFILGPVPWYLGLIYKGIKEKGRCLKQKEVYSFDESNPDEKNLENGGTINQKMRTVSLTVDESTGL